MHKTSYHARYDKRVATSQILRESVVPGQRAHEQRPERAPHGEAAAPPAHCHRTSVCCPPDANMYII